MSVVMENVKMDGGMKKKSKLKVKYERVYMSLFTVLDSFCVPSENDDDFVLKKEDMRKILDAVEFYSDDVDLQSGFVEENILSKENVKSVKKRMKEERLQWKVDHGLVEPKKMSKRRGGKKKIVEEEVVEEVEEGLVEDKKKKSKRRGGGKKKIVEEVVVEEVEEGLEEDKKKKELKKKAKKQVLPSVEPSPDMAIMDMDTMAVDVAVDVAVVAEKGPESIAGKEEEVAQEEEEEPQQLRKEHTKKKNTTTTKKKKNVLLAIE